MTVHLADYKSAVQQIENLRYEAGANNASEHDRGCSAEWHSARRHWSAEYRLGKRQQPSQNAK